MSNTFDGLSDINHEIPLSQASAMTALFRANKEAILQTIHQGSDILPTCESFNRTIFDKLLSIPSCVGIRIYYGMSDDLKIHAVLVAFDVNGADIVSGQDGVTGEFSVPCPPYCPPPSPLNGNK